MTISNEQLAATMHRITEIRNELMAIARNGEAAQSDSRRPAQLRGELTTLKRLPWLVGESEVSAPNA